MYEVQNRSIDEHEEFSMQMERKSLPWLYEANSDFISQMQRVNQIDNMVAHGQLKGSIMKQKILSSSRLYGLGYLGVASLAYMKMASLTMMMGPVAPTVGIVSLAVMGARKFAE